MHKYSTSQNRVCISCHIHRKLQPCKYHIYLLFYLNVIYRMFHILVLTPFYNNNTLYFLTRNYHRIYRIALTYILYTY